MTFKQPGEVLATECPYAGYIAYIAVTAYY